MLQPDERGLLRLADALPGQPSSADRLERQASPSKPKRSSRRRRSRSRQLGEGEYAPTRRAGDSSASSRDRGARVGEEIAELAVAVVSDRLVQRDGRLDRLERLLDVLEREPGRLRELLDGRLRGRARLELAPRRGELVPALVDVRRHADRRATGSQRSAARLADPPGGVRRELEPLAPVELLDRPVEPDDAVLDQVEEAAPRVRGSAWRSRRRGGGSS